MLTVSVINQKGGVGKSTLATNLAAAAHLAGLSTMILDLDSQGSSFDWFVRRAEGSALDGLAVVKADRELSIPRMREVTKGMTREETVEVAGIIGLANMLARLSVLPDAC